MYEGEQVPKTLETPLTGTEVLSVTDADGNHQQTDFIMNDPEKELSWDQG